MRLVVVDYTDQAALTEQLKGIDVVVSAVVFNALQDQIPLAAAAKEAGVKRFVPCFFGSPMPRGLHNLYDNVSCTDSHFRHQIC